MTLLIVRIEDTRTHQTEQRILGDWHKCMKAGVLIGSDAVCHVHLTGSQVAERHARYYALSHHRFLDILDDAAVVRFPGSDSAARKGDYLRVDYRPFMIGPYVLTFGEQSEPG
jgi:hypothetical protein